MEVGLEFTYIFNIGGIWCFPQAADTHTLQLFISQFTLSGGLLNSVFLGQTVMFVCLVFLLILDYNIGVKQKTIQ